MRCLIEALSVTGCSSKNSAGAYPIRTPWMAQNVENWISSVSVWKSQPFMPSMSLALTRYPEPDTAQEVWQIMRALLR